MNESSKYIVRYDKQPYRNLYSNIYLPPTDWPSKAVSYVKLPLWLFSVLMHQSRPTSSNSLTPVP